MRVAPSPLFARFKAFVIDMFMIAMPLLYLMTYAVLGSKEAFLDNQLAILAVWIIFGLIQSLFFSLKAQSPGYRANEIFLSTINGKKPSFLTAFLRYFFFITLFIFGGSLVCLFRRDRRALHDLLSGTIVVAKSP